MGETPFHYQSPGKSKGRMPNTFPVIAGSWRKDYGEARDVTHVTLMTGTRVVIEEVRENPGTGTPVS